MRKPLKPLIDAIDLDIGNAVPIATLRAKLAVLREQTDALESDCHTAQVECDDLKAKLNQSQSEVARLSDDLAAWQQPKSQDQQTLEDLGAWPGH